MLFFKITSYILKRLNTINGLAQSSFDFSYWMICVTLPKGFFTLGIHVNITMLLAIQFWSTCFINQVVTAEMGYNPILIRYGTSFGADIPNQHSSSMHAACL